MATTSTAKAERQDPGSFWVDCANAAKGKCLTKSGKTQGHLSPKGKPILCRKCQAAAKARAGYLEQPTKAEKAAYVRGRGKSTKRSGSGSHKRVTARQKAQLAARGTKAPVTKKGRPKAKAV